MVESIKEYLAEVSELVLKIPPDSIERITSRLLDAYKSRNRVFVFGNGGGSSTSAHFVCDLSKGTAVNGKPRLKAISLAENIPLLTAWANDTDYTNTFGEQLKNLVEKGDVVVGLSGSGMSPNVINAFKVADEAGATAILFSGFKGGDAIKEVCDSIVVPSEDMQQIEDVHMILTHIIFRCLKREIAGL